MNGILIITVGFTLNQITRAKKYAATCTKKAWK